MRPKAGDIIVYYDGLVPLGPFTAVILRTKRYGITEIQWLSGPWKGQKTKWTEFFYQMLLDSNTVKLDAA